MVSLHTLIDNVFGVRTRSNDNPVNTAMTTTAQLIARNDSSRLALAFVNHGQQVVVVRNRLLPTATLGYAIGPNGGSLTLIFNEDFYSVGHDWFGITPAGLSTIFVQEVLVEPNA